MKQLGLFFARNICSLRFLSSRILHPVFQLFFLQVLPVAVGFGLLLTTVVLYRFYFNDGKDKKKSK